MSGVINTKKFPLLNVQGKEIAVVSLEHLWADVYGLKYKRTDENPQSAQWADAIKQSIAESEMLKARFVAFRLIKDSQSNEISRLLPQLGFKKKNERVEFKKPIDELPDDTGSPVIWKTALELGWSPQDIANTLKLVSEGDPDTDPNEDPLLYIQDFLADPVLTFGLQCIHIGYVDSEVAALTVVQINPKNGWSRISYMGIALKFRKQSLGKWVHRYSFKIMKTQGGKLYHGGTVATNTRMIRLFELHNCNRFCEMEEWIYTIPGGYR